MNKKRADGKEGMIIHVDREYHGAIQGPEQTAIDGLKNRYKMNVVFPPIGKKSDYIQIEGPSFSDLFHASQEIDQMEEDAKTLLNKPVNKWVRAPPSFFYSHAETIEATCKRWNVRWINHPATQQVWNSWNPVREIHLKGMERNVLKAKATLESLIPSFRSIYIPEAFVDDIVGQCQWRLKAIERKHRVTITLPEESLPSSDYLVAIIEDEDSEMIAKQLIPACLAAKTELLECLASFKRENSSGSGKVREDFGMDDVDLHLSDEDFRTSPDDDLSTMDDDLNKTMSEMNSNLPNQFCYGNVIDYQGHRIQKLKKKFGVDVLSGDEPVNIVRPKSLTIQEITDIDY